MPWWVTLIGQASHLWRLILSGIYLPLDSVHTEHWVNTDWVNCAFRSPRTLAPEALLFSPVWGSRAQGGQDGTVWIGRGFTRTVVLLSLVFPSTHLPGPVVSSFHSRGALYLISKICPLWPSLLALSSFFWVLERGRLLSFHVAPGTLDQLAWSPGKIRPN